MTTLGTLILELSAPTTTLQTDLRRAEEMVKATAKAWEIKPTWGIASSLHDELRATRSILNSGLKGMESDAKGYRLKIDVDWGAIDRLNGKSIVPVVDDRALTKLNQHLSLKEEHLDRVVSKFASTKIAPQVDDRQLTELNRLLDGFVGSRQIKLQVAGDSLSSDITKSIEKGFKSAKGNLVSNIITKTVDTATSPVRSIARGALENFGKALTDPFSQGIAGALNAAMSGTIGSQALVGEKIGETIAAKIREKIGKSLGIEIKDLAEETLGRENIDRESGDATLKSRKTKASKTKSGAEGLNIQRQNVERERISTLAELEELKAQDAELENKKASLAKRIEAYSDRQFRARAIGNTKAQAWLATRDRVLRSGYTDIEAAQADLQVAIVQKQPEVEKLALKRDRLSTRIDNLSPQQPYSYRQVAEEVAGRKLKDEELPKLLVADARLKGMGGTAAYNATANTISVRKDLYDKIQSGNLDAQGYKETVHELTHGADAGFGKLGQLREYQAGRIPQKTYSTEEVAYAAPFVAQYAPNQRAKEMSAFVAEHRLAPGLYDHQNRQNALTQFQSDDNFGFGGSRYQKFVGASQVSQKQQLSSLVGLVPSSEIEDLIKIRKQLSEKSTALVTQINQSIGRGSLAPGLEDAVIANINEFEQFEKILELTKAKASEATPKTSPVADPWADNAPKSNPLARIANGAKQAAGKAGELSRAVGDEIALDKAAFGLAVDGTRQAIDRVQQFGGKFNQIAGSVGKVISPITGVVNSGYQIAQGVENAVLPMIPFGRQIKSAGKNIALPAAAYAGMGLLPGGAAIQGALGGAMHSALALPGAGAVEAVGGAVGSAFGGVPMLGGALTSASTALAGSVVEGAITLLTPILAGKAVMGIAGQGAKLALPAAKKPDYEYVEVGQKVAQKAIGAAQSMVKTEYEQLPPAREKLQLGGREQLQLPPTPSPQASKEWQAIARERIIDIRQKLDNAINSGNKSLAQKLYAQFDAQVAEFDKFVQGASVSVGKEKTVTNQAVVGKWEKVKADRAKKIEAIIVDDNESLRIEDRQSELEQYNQHKAKQSSDDDAPKASKIEGETDAAHLARLKAEKAAYLQALKAKSPEQKAHEKKVSSAHISRQQSVNKIVGIGDLDKQSKLMQEFLAKPETLDLGISNRVFLQGSLLESIQEYQARIKTTQEEQKISSQRFNFARNKGKIQPEQEAQRVTEVESKQRELIEFEKELAKKQILLEGLDKISNQVPAVIQPLSRSIAPTLPAPVVSAPISLGSTATKPINPIAIPIVPVVPNQPPNPVVANRQNQLLLAPAKPLGRPIGEGIRDPWEQQFRSTTSAPTSKLLPRQQRLEALNSQIYERKIEQTAAILNQLALPPAKPLGRPIGEPIRDPWEQNKKAIPPQSRLLSREERLQALNTQIFERKIEQQSKILNQLSLPQGKDYSIPDPWAPIMPNVRVLQPPLPPRPKSLVYTPTQSVPLPIPDEPLGRPIQGFRVPLGRPIAPPSVDRLNKAVLPTEFNPQSDGILRIPGMGKIEREIDNKNLYRVSPAARRFDRAYDQANRNIDKSIGDTKNGIEFELDRIEKGGSKILPTTSALDKLIGFGKLGLAVFGGYTLLSLGVPAMISLGKATLDTAKNFETLQVKLAAASDSAQSGRSSFARITAKADELGVSRSGALEVGAGIAGTTFGTELEGKPSDILTDKTLQFFKARGLNKQQQEGFQLAATQTLGRKNLSGQEVNQFIQSAGITDTRSIAARGMGLTPAQFAAMQDGPGIDSKKFMQAFLSQGVQDARTGEALASQTAGYKESQLSAKTEVLQGSIGAGISPVYKAGIDLLTNSIGLLNTAIESGKSALIGFAINGLLFAGSGLIKLAIQFGLPAVAMATFKSLIVANAAQIGAAMVKLGVQFAAFYVLGEGIQLLGKKWSNSAQEIEDSANKITTALSKLDKNKTPDLTKPKTAEDVQGDGWVDTATLWAQRNITKPIFQKQQDIGNAIFDNPFSVGLRKQLGITAQKPEQPIIADNKQKADQEIREAIDKVSYNTKVSIGASEQAGRKGKQMAEVDLAIARIDTERSGLFSSGNPDAGKIAELNKRYNEKFKERGALDEDTAPAKAAAQESINAIKGAQAFLDKKNEAGQIGQDTYIAKTDQLKIDLKAAEDAQRKLNEAIKSGFDNLTPWVLTLDKIVGKFEDITTNAQLGEQKLSIARNTKFTSGKLTPGESEYQASLDRQGSIRTQTTDTAKTIKELRSALNAKDPNNVANVQKAYGIDNETTATQIKIRAEKATSLVDKETLTKLAVIKEQEYKLTGLQSQLSDARAEMYKRIESENREAMLYYVSLAKQIDPVGSAFNKAISNITVEKNRLISKLEGYNNGLFDGFTNSIIELFDSAKRRMDIAKNLAKEKKDALDTRVDIGNQRETTRRNSFSPEGQQSAAPSAYPAGTNPTSNSAQQTPNSQLPTPQPPTKNRQVTATQAAPGYTRSSPGLQPKIDADLSRLTPAERERYLHTTLSVDGKTDLAPDEWDRKWNPSVFKRKQSQPPTGGVRSVTSQSNSQPVSQPARLPQSPAVTKAATVETQTWVDKQAQAANTVYGQAITNADANARSMLSEEDLKAILSKREATRTTRRNIKEEASQQRKQQQAAENLAPAITIQERQRREFRDYDLAGTDKRDEIEEKAITFNEKLTTYRDVLIPTLKTYADGTNPELQKYSKEDRARFIPQYQQKLKDSQKLLKELEQGAAFYTKLLTGYNKQLAIGRAKIVEQQKYDNEVTAEQNQIKEREGVRSNIESERAGVQIGLKDAQFNPELQDQNRTLEKSGEQIRIENERVQKQRDITDRKRKGEFLIGRSPEQAKAYEQKLQSNVEAWAKRQLANTVSNFSQQAKQSKFELENEQRGLNITGAGLNAANETITDRNIATADKTDSPFANNVALDREFKRKLQSLDDRAREREQKYEADKRKYNNSPLMTEIESQYQQANFNDLRDREAVRGEYSVSTNDRDSSRREHLYGRQKSQFSADLGVYDAGIQSQKLRGQDTRFEEYTSRKSSIQADTSQQKFDLNQRRAKITALTPEADAERAAIDKLLASLDRLEGIKLNNLATEFSELTQIIGSTQKATREVLGDFVKTGKFDWKKIVRAPFEQLANFSLDKLTSGLFAGLNGGQAQAPQPGGGGGGLLGSLLGGILGFADGGIIGQGRSKADDQLILAQRGEGIITHRGMDMLGERGLHMLNRGLPPLPKFATGGVVGSLNNVSMNLDSNRIENSSSNNVNFNIDNRGGGGQGNGNKQLMKELEAAVTHVLIKQKRAQTGLV